MTNSKPHISFVSPVYMAETIVDELFLEIEKVMQQINTTYEVVLVDDGSSDSSWDKIKTLAHKNKSVKAIKLSRNFGQHPAIMAGLAHTKGDWVVVLDCDLQDQPKEVLKLYEEAQKGFDVVLAKRLRRKDGFFKRVSSMLFAKLYGYLTNTNFNHEIANFGIYNRKSINAILKIGDYIKSFPLFNSWIGFNQSSVYVNHSNRFEGKSSYNYSKLLLLAFDTIISFSNKPLKLFIRFGVFISAISFLFGIYNIIQYFNGKISVLGYTSIIISIWFLSGIILTSIGITGIYIGKIFNQTKGRPSYIIDNIVSNGA